jgi:hypothetical protein
MVRLKDADQAPVPQAQMPRDRQPSLRRGTERTGFSPFGAFSVLSASLMRFLAVPGPRILVLLDAAIITPLRENCK